MDSILWRVDTKEKVIALTFDDGPNPKYTPQILTILNKYNYKATFFLKGANINKNKDLVKKIDLEGHEIGNHTFSHYDLKDLSMQEISQEIERTNKEINNVLLKKVLLFRPPFGSYNDIVLNEVRKKKLDVIMWTKDKTKNLDSRDWIANPNAIDIYNRLKSKIEPGDIVLFHDSSHNGDFDRQRTVKAVELLTEYLNKENYKLVTISELKKYSGK